MVTAPWRVAANTTAKADINIAVYVTRSHSISGLKRTAVRKNFHILKIHDFFRTPLTGRLRGLERIRISPFAFALTTRSIPLVTESSP
jgi:hypothetical protein